MGLVLLDSDDLDYEPQIDVERFRKLLALAELEASKVKNQEQRAVHKPFAHTQRPQLKQGQLGTLCVVNI